METGEKLGFDCHISDMSHDLTSKKSDPFLQEMTDICSG